MIALDRKTYSATVANTASLSGAVSLGASTAVGIVLPSTFATNTAAILFHVSADGSTYQILRDNDGTAVSVTVAAANTNLHTHLDPSKFAGWSSLKVGTYQSDLATAVNQDADKAITIIGARVTG